MLAQVILQSMRGRICAAFVVAVAIVCAGCGDGDSSAGTAAPKADANQAGIRAAKDYIASLGSANVEMKTGIQYPEAESPYAPQASAIRTAIVNLVNARTTLEKARQNDPQAVAGATAELDAAGIVAAEAYVDGMTAPRQHKFLDITKYEVEDFAAMFKSLPPAAQVTGARLLTRWNEKKEARDDAPVGYAQEVLDEIAKRFPAVASANLSR